MIRKKEDRDSVNGMQVYATQKDFCRIFGEDTNALYLLSLLLTGDAEKAEQCFVSGLENTTQGNPVFREWARSWSKRVIIKNAIRMISPGGERINRVPRVSKQDTWGAGLPDEIAAVLQLAPLERFVFVMSVLEGYSIQECSILLSRTTQEVAKARTGALLSLSQSRPQGAVLPGKDNFREAHFLQPAQVA